METNKHQSNKGIGTGIRPSIRSVIRRGVNKIPTGRIRHSDPKRAESSELSEDGRDEAYHILSSQRRRLTIAVLCSDDTLVESDGGVEFTDLVDAVAEAEYGTSVDTLDTKKRKRVYSSLYQSHLSKLIDVGIVDGDVDRGKLQSTSKATELNNLLQAGDEILGGDW